MLVIFHGYLFSPKNAFFGSPFSLFPRIGMVTFYNLACTEKQTNRTRDKARRKKLLRFPIFPEYFC